jgi:hypothetical protein
LILFSSNLEGIDELLFAGTPIEIIETGTIYE